MLRRDAAAVAAALAVKEPNRPQTIGQKNLTV